MRKIYLSLVAILFSTLLFSQTSGGPDAYGYTWKNSNHSVSPPTYNWVDITVIGEPVMGLADDNIIGPFSNSSGFQFYWYPTPTFYIGSNGFISFNGNNIASPFPPSIPLSSGANNWISPMLADLNFSGTGNPAQCYFYSSIDSLVVSYINVPFWYNSTAGYTGSCTFQIILNKVDKSITYNYQSMNLGTATLDNAIGIENVSGNIGLQSMIDVLPGNLFTIKYYYPSVVTYAVTDGGTNWNDNDKNAGVFIKKGVSMAMTTNLKNFGNQSLSNFGATFNVKNSNGIQQATGTVSNISLTAGNDTTVTFSTQFYPTTTGRFSYNTTVTGIAGDMVASNNSIKQEINVIDTSVAIMILDYTDGIPDGGGLGWNGGGGGVGIYVEPPAYPCKVINSRFMITANDVTTPQGFYAKIYDDNGPSGSAGTLLDSVYVSPNNFNIGSYVTVPVVNQNIIIDNGGVYLFWDMGGPNINIGRDTTSPISRRTFEVLGNSWADYRDKYTEDFLIGLGVSFTPPVADYSFDTIFTPIINFTDQSVGTPTSWLWDFDDNGATSIVQNPSYTFVTSGNHNVCLISTNSHGSDTICKVVNISNYPPTANFTYSIATMPTISFTDLSVFTPTAWQWDFDDSGNDTSSLQNPVYAFTADGSHNVCLIASNAYGSSASYCTTINITGTGIYEITAQNLLLVFPNPVSDIATIKIESSSNYQNLKMKCYNILGEAIDLDYTVSSNKIEFKKGLLSAGTYVFEITNNNVKIGKGKFFVK